MNRFRSWAGRGSSKDGKQYRGPGPTAPELTDGTCTEVSTEATTQQTLSSSTRSAEGTRPLSDSADTRHSEALGLQILAQGNNPTVDIVAVHGLNGHREKTWTAKDGTLWLRDLLPSHIPQARILTHGYDARTHGSSHGPGHITTQYLYDHAIAFASRLSSFRSNTKTEKRPLIFIAHSLGGILVKSALIYSHFCGPLHLPELQAIKTATYAIMFFGTPNCGSNSASWGVAVLNIASLFAKTDTSIIKHLQTNSEWLRQSMDQFTAISGQFEIIYCYEKYKTPLVLGKSTLIVPRHSAMVAGAPNTETIGLMKDHKELVRFESCKDEDYVVIMSRLQVMLSKCHAVIDRRWEHQEAQHAGSSRENRTEPRRRDHNEYKLPFRPPVGMNRSFVGRKAHLQQIKDRLHTPASEDKSLGSSISDGLVILYGLGGMGKTQLALKYAWENAEAYSAVLWINASKERDAHLDFRNTAKRYVEAMIEESDAQIRQMELRKLHLGTLVNANGEVSFDEANLNEITKGVISFLERYDNDNWLLILDNVDDLRSFTISDFLPKSPSRKVIVTSRLTATTRLGYAVEVDQADEEDAVEILLNNSPLRTKSPTDQEVCRRIARTLGYLPLALEQVGAYVNDSQLRLDEFLPLFHRHRQELLSRVTPDEIYTARKETVFTTWELSFSRISSQDPDAAQLMLLFAYMHHESLWEGMFLLAAETEPSTSNTPLSNSLAWLWELCRDEYRFKNAISHILSVSLAKRGPSTGSLYLHPLVHAWSRDRLEVEERSQKQLQTVIVLGQALFSISKRPQTTETWSPKQRLLLHADVCIGFTDTNRTSTQFYSLFQEPAAAPSLFQIVNLYHDFGRLKQAEELLSSILSFTATHLPEGPILECRLEFAGILESLGRHDEALEQYLKVVASIGTHEDRQMTDLKANAGLGRIYWVMARYPESERNLKVVTETLKSSVGRLGPLGQQAASNLGLLYWHRGELKEALKILDEVLEEVRSDGAELDVTYFEHMYRRAIVVQAMGHYQEARRTFLEVFTMRQKLLGSDNLETCQAANALGHLHCFLGEFDQAKKFFDTAWSGQQSIGLGMSHPAVIRTLFNYGVLNRERGLYDEAFECLDRASLWQRRVHGDRHHSYLSGRIELAVLALDCGAPEKAINILNSVRQVQQEDYPQDKPECIQATVSLADALTQIGELLGADSLLAMIIPIVKQAFGDKHPAFLQALISRSLLRRLQGRSGEAVEELEDTVTTLGTVCGAAHPRTLIAEALLGQIYREIGRKEEGRERIVKALEAMKNTLGNEHPKTRNVEAMLFHCD